ncbi:hypothetical protein DIZ76_015222 [Coccidioides immitis]|nr:hypothetical protein DIZ76_015222 [Coccidioides immitis]
MKIYRIIIISAIAACPFAIGYEYPPHDCQSYGDDYGNCKGEKPSATPSHYDEYGYKMRKRGAKEHSYCDTYGCDGPMEPKPPKPTDCYGDCEDGYDYSPPPPKKYGDCDDYDGYCDGPSKTSMKPEPPKPTDCYGDCKDGYDYSPPPPPKKYGDCDYDDGYCDGSPPPKETKNYGYHYARAHDKAASSGSTDRPASTPVHTPTQFEGAAGILQPRGISFVALAIAAAFYV